MTIIRAMCLGKIGIVTFFTSRTSANLVSSRFFFKTESTPLFLVIFRRLLHHRFSRAAIGTCSAFAW